MRPSQHNSNSGFSLLGSLVFISILGIFATVASRRAVNAFRLNKVVADKVFFEVIDKAITDRISCLETRTKTPSCTAGQVVELYGKRPDGSDYVLVSNKTTGTRFGAYTLRAECSDANGEYVLLAAKLQSTASVGSTQTANFLGGTGAPQAWSDRRTLVNPRVCGKSRSWPDFEKPTFFNLQAYKYSDYSYMSGPTCGERVTFANAEDYPLCVVSRQWARIPFDNSSGGYGSCITELRTINGIKKWALSIHGCTNSVPEYAASECTYTCYGAK